MNIILHPVETGIAIVIPTGVLPIEDVAQKDVPAGVPFLYATMEDDLPPDDDFREAWEADFSEPDGYGIGADAWFAAQPQTPTSPQRPQRPQTSSTPQRPESQEL
jgi:hypothetical protein